MKINSVNNNSINQTNFGHTFRVNICIKKANGTGYDFVSPATNTKLYKKLNSKVVRWLNEDFLTRLRTSTNTPRQKEIKKTSSDKWNKSRLTRILYNLDSDYRKFGIVRSVYNKFGLGYLATGVDVPIIENLKGAKEIGKAKSELLHSQGITHNSIVDDIVKKFNSSAKKYVQDPINLLRSKNGKELMLDLNFIKSGVDKKGNNLYELDNFNFMEIKKSETIDPVFADLERSKQSAFNEIKDTLRHQIKSITGQDDKTVSDIDTVLKPTEPLTNKKPVRRRKNKDVPGQLTLQFKD